MSEERDPLEDRLRASLSASAEEVTPRGDGLARIRERIVERQNRSPWTRLRAQLARPAFAAASSVGVIVLGLTAAIGVGQVSAGNSPFGLGGDKSSSPATDPSHDASRSSASTPSKSSKPDNMTSAGTPTKNTHGPKPPSEVTVPVYHITKTSSGYQLTRSSHQIEVSGSKRNRQEERAEGAYRALYDGGPQLHSTGAGVWQAGTSVTDADLVGSTLQVRFSSAARSGSESTAEAARAALKQVVYTGLAAVPSATAVQILVDGAPVSSFWGILPVNSSGVQRGDSALTRPFNTITAPKSESINLAPIEIKGDGAYAGGRAHWYVSQNGQTVRSGSVSTGTEGFASWSATVELDPGPYLLKTYGQSGSGPRNVQTVSFSVSE